ncbi:cold-shock protein [Pedobacter endophyticus]|uniref:Cold shock domain-containing protein n=1 Tax=Pedobacter endophyticus TaxID=2789740 RepID=A0A7S9KY42_9SPHI|nr:cold shock domain-containing protein [Pedobacter endophyticus]QPH38956.1 cold shock domain-containing protein [Pedobacter endophyticus]
MKTIFELGTFMAFYAKQMRLGKIKMVDTSKGIGFIEDENEQDIAFCLENTNDSLCAGDQVAFEIVLGEHGLMATNIKQI